jgi:tRNA dimethylallyltransferase
VNAVPGNNVPLIAVVGPTGSGKSSLAVALAEHLDTEIISVDSMQFYRGMEIGTAAPTLDDQRRIAHHFVSFLNPDEEITAGSYQEMARERVAQINETGRSAVAAGGSGMYVSALIDGIFDGPSEDPAIRARLYEEAERLGNEHLLERVRTVDPEYATRITGSNDLIRIVRALEVYEITGQPLSVLHQEHRERTPSLPCLQFALAYENRQDLYDRIDRRVEQMIEAGWVEEVQRLIDKGYGPQLERLKALGFREIAAHLRGEKTRDEAIAAAQMHHRRYAKRQLTWFRADPRIHWIPAGPGTTTETQLTALLHILDTHNEESPKNRSELHGFLARGVPL